MSGIKLTIMEPIIEYLETANIKVYEVVEFNLIRAEETYRGYCMHDPTLLIDGLIYDLRYVMDPYNNYFSNGDCNVPITCEYNELYYSKTFVYHLHDDPENLESELNIIARLMSRFLMESDKVTVQLPDKDLTFRSFFLPQFNRG